MEKINKTKIILFIIFIILVSFSLFIFNNQNKVEIEDNKNNKKEVLLLNDYNRFFTVNSCVYKYINYLQTKDINSILKVLNKDYLILNNIDSNNIFNYVEDLNGIYSFKSKEIYYEKINDNNYIYYVYGELIKESINGYVEINERYYTLNFDIKNQLFDITPFDNIGYKEVING